MTKISAGGGRVRLRARAVWTGEVKHSPPGGPLIGADVVVSGDRIAELVPSASPLRDGEILVDLGDIALVPGLIDAHLHLLGADPVQAGIGHDWAGTYRALGAVADLRRLLEAGFTTVRCMGSPAGPALAGAVADGLVDGPLIVAAGHYICRTGGTWDYRSPEGERSLEEQRRSPNGPHGPMPLRAAEWTDAASRPGTRAAAGVWPDPAVMIADDVQAGRTRVRERVSEGAGVIKVGVSSGSPGVDLVQPWADSPEASRSNYGVDELRAIVDEAHRAGLRVAVHAIGEEAVRTSVLAGVDSVEHGHGAGRATYELMAERGIFLVPTLALPAMRARFGAERGLAPRLVDVWKRHHEQQLTSVALALECGVTIAAGTDFLGPPYTPLGENAYEFQLLVEAGLSARQALTAGTAVAARVLGLAAEIGTLTPGKRADIVGVRGRPWEDPGSLRRIEFVMQAGRIVKAPSS